MTHRTRSTPPDCTASVWNRLLPYASSPLLTGSLGFVLALIGLPHLAAGGTISIAVQLTATMSGHHQLRAELAISNTGDEAAFNLRSTIEFEDARTVAQLADVLEPSRTVRPVVTLQTKPLATPDGGWPVIVRVSYTDANKHPFEALHVGIVRIGPDNEAPRIELELSASPVAQSGTATASLRSDTAESIELTFIAPSSVTLQPQHVRVRLEAGVASTHQVIVTNTTATAGSRLPLFALARYVRPDGHHRTEVVSTMLTIEPAVPANDTPRRLAFLLGTLVVAWMLILVRAARRNRSRHDS